MNLHRSIIFRLLPAYLVGALIFAVAILIAYLGWRMAADAWIKEDEIRQQRLIEKGFILKAPAMRKQFKIEDCVIVKDEMRCIYFDKGIRKVVVAQ